MDDAYVVSPEWTEAHLEDPSVRLVDVRDAWEFDAIGHVPGAVNVPFDSYRDEDSDEPGTLPGATAFADLLEAAGIEPDDTIVVYDDMHGVFAARFVLTARVYGHEDVRLLDGDFSAWNRERETTSDEREFEPSSYDPEPLSAEESPLIDLEGVEAALERDAIFVDTRERDEYEEARLPGAVRFDWREVVDDETRRLKPEAELEELLAEHGITPDREIILYCNTARRISHTYVVLRALGYENIGFYEGSLTEWIAADGALESGSE
ncbi:sulfurtransferase [Halostagnicola kamekurae]|uniref:Thiosulfate/3-mercaptopyruvate sulfurtransferase n=1 Tax=Halostagnicola kamekurae TaxID=619731 RepID=A0A1I6PFV3_9EURY|nr:sulfurtransferase [Halostagnicola kamekurae]SFS39043.1 thiosulfate/3-mercaptopyruvate sulfurtransferase [Halostagnicola kamekurae]